MTDTITLDIQSDSIVVSGMKLQRPFSFKKLCELFGTPLEVENKHVNNTTYNWRALGMRTFVKPNSDIVHRLDIYFHHRDIHSMGLETVFPGTVTLNGSPIEDVITDEPDDMGIIDISYGDTDLTIIKDNSEGKLQAIYISSVNPEPYVPKVSEPLHPVKAKNPVVFTDFNFKLAVIQELMFGDAPVLEPFRLTDFVAGYPDRTINPALEGAQPIPEVVDFFKAYEIEQSYADTITSLYLDGGNDIYHEIAPQWEGDTPVFDIADFSDVINFKNLKEITNELFPMSETLKAQLQDVGIIVD